MFDKIQICYGTYRLDKAVVLAAATLCVRISHILGACVMM